MERPPSYCMKNNATKYIHIAERTNQTKVENRNNMLNQTQHHFIIRNTIYPGQSITA
jgi:hypothetical protein